MGKSKRLRTIIKQAKMGKPHAMYELGICYRLGRGLQADMLKAVQWISASAALGYGPAVEWIEDYSFDDDACVQASS